MKLYELTYLISPELSEEQAKEFSQKICSLIQEEQGILDAINPVKCRSAAILPEAKLFNRVNPVRAKKQNEFYVTTLNFRCDPRNLETLRKKLSMEKQISRYMILNKPKISSKIKKVRTKPITTFKTKVGGEPIVKTKEKKVELKNIAKKLEEILET